MEVIMPLVWLIHCGSPGWMILRWEKWVFSINPSFFETLDGLGVFFLTHCEYQVVVFNFSAISQQYLVLLREELVHSDSL
jgi:hypothetical protein